MKFVLLVFFAAMAWAQTDSAPRVENRFAEYNGNKRLVHKWDLSSRSYEFQKKKPETFKQWWRRVIRKKKVEPTYEGPKEVAIVRNDVAHTCLYRCRLLTLGGITGQAKQVSGCGKVLAHGPNPFDSTFSVGRKDVLMSSEHDVQKLRR
jgi:hypothetical protein